MKVYTSYFARQKKMELPDTAYISIAVGNPKYPVPYELKNANTLKPYGVFGKYEGDEYEIAYRKKLDRTGTAKIRSEVVRLAEGHENVMLMCHEKDPSICHRRIFAKWWEEKTGQEIPEFGHKTVPVPKEETLEERQEDLFSILP